MRERGREREKKKAEGREREGRERERQSERDGGFAILWAVLFQSTGLFRLYCYQQYESDITASIQSSGVSVDAFNVLILCCETTFGAEKHITIKSDILSDDVRFVTASYCVWSYSASNISLLFYTEPLRTKCKTKVINDTLIHTAWLVVKP